MSALKTPNGKPLKMRRFPDKSLKRRYMSLSKEELVDALLCEGELRYIAEVRLYQVREAVNSDAPVIGGLVERNGALVKP